MMYTRALVFFCFFFSTIPHANAERIVNLTEWQSPEGVERLERSRHKVDFFPLANHFEPQENKIFCGVASSVIVLNVLRLGTHSDALPQDQSLLVEAKRRYLPLGFDPIFRRYTQNTIFKDQAKSEIQILGQPLQVGEDIKTDYGLQLRQLHVLLVSHGLDVTIRVVEDGLENEIIKQELIENLKTEGDYVLVNYARPALGQKGSGHISPLGAYDAVSDSFLIMDVNPNAAGWVWVNAADLISAMRSFDTIENRGYLMIKN